MASHPSPPTTVAQPAPSPRNGLYKFFVPGFPLEAEFMDFFHQWISSLDLAEPPQEQVLRYDDDDRLIEPHDFAMCGCEQEECILFQWSSDDDDEESEAEEIHV